MAEFTKELDKKCQETNVSDNELARGFRRNNDVPKNSSMPTIKKAKSKKRTGGEWRKEDPEVTRKKKAALVLSDSSASASVKFLC